MMKLNARRAGRLRLLALIFGGIGIAQMPAMVVIFWTELFTDPAMERAVTGVMMAAFLLLPAVSMILLLHAQECDPVCQARRKRAASQERRRRKATDGTTTAAAGATLSDGGGAGSSSCGDGGGGC